MVRTEQGRLDLGLQQLVDEVAQPPWYTATAVAEDLELLERWRTGDNTAGDALVTRHWASIARFFRSKIGDDGADLISQTFLACVEQRDVIVNVKAFLFAVARRRLADHLRQRARAPELDLALSSLADLAPGPVTELVARERGELLHAGLARIPLDDQIAIELAYFEGMAMEDIASVLEINPNTVRSRLSRARDKLREVLATLATPDEAALAESQLG
jgi:RNA polymerase sigma factor (sigma-70 family)